MGQEILYCSKCQTQLRSADFEKEKAYRLHNSVFCYKCARESVHSLPPETIKQLLGQIARQEETAEKKNSSTSRILRVVEIRSSKAGTQRRAAGAGAPPPGPVAWIALGGLSAVTLLVWVIASGSSEPKTPSRAPSSPAAIQPPPPNARPVAVLPGPQSPPPPPTSSPPASAGTFDAEATESLRRAREFARMNPGDLVGQIALFEKAAWDASGTPLQDAALRDLEGLKAKDRGLAAKDLPGLLDSVRAAASKEDFGQAQKLLEQARKQHAVNEWTSPVEKALKELRGQAESLYGPLKEKALAAAHAKNAADLAAVRERIAKWSLEEFRTDLERDIDRATLVRNPEAPPPPVRPAPQARSEPPTEPVRSPKPAEADSDPGLVARWTFDEGKGPIASDSSRNRNPATLVSGASWTEGKWGGALALNGAEAHVVVSPTPSLADLGPLTVSAWVKPGTLKLGRIVAKESGARGRWMLIAGESGIAFAKDYSERELRRESVPNLLAPNQWQHLAMTWDGSAQVDKIHIYVNGVEPAYARNQDGAGSKMSDASIPLLIGNRGDLARGFQGAIDDVRIYSRVLSVKEITALASPKAK
ncbi:MAG TPA: LamG domain-containing protein [Planctomycetota bacterium]|nr:LamG domain-containing protein [Planctomycetota bacterium]